VKGIILFSFVIPFPLIAAAGLMTKLISILVTRKLLPDRAWAAWLQGAGLSLCLAVLSYSAGVGSGGLFYLADIEDLCRDKPLGSPATIESLFPLHNSCHYADGTTVDLVPGLVNPLVFIFMAAAFAGLVLTIITARSGASRAAASP
jgi:hypothetical protein